jgi:hypothetical protein
MSVGRKSLVGAIGTTHWDKRVFTGLTSLSVNSAYLAHCGGFITDVVARKLLEREEWLDDLTCRLINNPWNTLIERPLAPAQSRHLFTNFNNNSKKLCVICKKNGKMR